VEVDSHTGKARNVIDEKSDTFVWSAHFDMLNMRAMNWVDGGKEIVYASEKDGWRLRAKGYPCHRLTVYRRGPKLARATALTLPGRSLAGVELAD